MRPAPTTMAKVNPPVPAMVIASAFETNRGIIAPIPAAPIAVTVAPAERMRRERGRAIAAAGGSAAVGSASAPESPADGSALIVDLFLSEPATTSAGARGSRPAVLVGTTWRPPPASVLLRSSATGRDTGWSP